MTLQNLEEQLLLLSPEEKLRIIQLLAQSLNANVVNDQPDAADKLSNFFSQSPLAEVVATENISLERDRSLPDDRFVP